MVKISLMPQESKFYPLFARSSHNVVEVSKAFKALLDDWHDVEPKIKQITDMEHVGDAITHEIMDLQ